MFQFYGSIAIRQSQTASETTSRKKETEQNYNKPQKRTKKKRGKKKKLKYTIHNVKLQIR